MDFSTALSVAQTLFNALQCSQLKDLCTMFDYKSKLNDLQNTVATIQAVLRDAGTKQKLSEQEILYIEELKDAVYDADDLFDELVTRAEKKKLTDDDFKVRLASFFKEFGVAYKMAQDVKKIKQKLDNIVSNHTRFSFKVDHEPIRMRREETCSYVNARTIIGRENDVEKIVGMLLNPDVQHDVSFVTVVGIGGLGKTALAQLLFNDERVIKAFSLRLWTCVSDEGQKSLETQAILTNILSSVAKTTKVEYKLSTMDLVQSQLRQELAKGPYLLVLDDLWTEKRGEWRKLEDYLMGGQRGSWVVVTTRSSETARIVGDGKIYELHGLSEESSWDLFEETVFESKRSNPHDQDLVEIGQSIVKRCAGVPLAIRVVGSLLYGRNTITEWKSFQEIGLGQIGEGSSGIMPILKLSYDHLEPSLKSCFSYCALFPKDYKIDKEMLTSLWMAQGYIVPLKKGQSIQDAVEDHFLILLRRCFFQDVEKHGDIMSFKIHDLMHDIAQEVSAKEICQVNSNNVHMDEKVRHLFIMRSGLMGEFSSKAGIRTYLQVEKCGSIDCLSKLLGKCVRLRALVLLHSEITSLPHSICKLLHLRYLNLSYNSMEVLPESITKLHKLDILMLCACSNLKELPKSLGKLANLTVLDISDCDGLTCLPSSMCKLTQLHMLRGLVLGRGSSSTVKQFHSELKTLKALNHLRGKLRVKVQVPENASYIKEGSGTGGAYMRSKEHLVSVYIKFIGESDQSIAYEEALLEELQPHSNLKHLLLKKYRGVRMPSWAKENNLVTFLPNLAWLYVGNCPHLQCVPWLGKLRHLKYFELESLPNLEYMESDNPAVPSGPRRSSGEEVSLFPCLEELHLYDLPKLKGWWLRSGEGLGLRVGHCHNSLSPCLHQLKTLIIDECPEMSSIPFCPRVEEVTIDDDNRNLKIKLVKKDVYSKMEVNSSSSNPSSSSSDFSLGNYPMALKGRTNNLKSLPLMLVGGFQPLTEMRIWGDKEVENLSEVGDLFQSSFLSSLRSLVVYDCRELNSFCGGLEHLTALESLILFGNDNLLFREEDEEEDREEEEDVIPWRSLPDTLRSLELDVLYMEHLPKGMQYLTSVESLTLWNSDLESLPKWMPKLTSLKKLEMNDCSPNFYQRCQSPSGEDWPKIQHIPRVVLKMERYAPLPKGLSYNFLNR